MREPLASSQDPALPAAGQVLRGQPATDLNPVRRAGSLTWLIATPVRQALLVAVLWRILMSILGVVAHYVMTPGPHLRSLIPPHSSPQPLTLILDPGVRNDAFWYARIVQHGYFYSTHHLSSIGFYPLYPLVTKAVSLAVPDVYLAGMLVSAACLFLAVATLAVWLEDQGLGHRAPVVTLLLLAFPFSFYFACMYSESLYLFLTLATFVTCRRGKWQLACVCAFLLVLTRPTGVVIVPALLAQAAIRGSWRLPGPALAPVVSALVGLLSFSVYQYAAFGTPLAYVHAKAVPPWSNTVSQAASDLLLHGRYGVPSWFLAMNLVVAVLFLAATPLVLKRFGPGYAVLSALSVLLPVTSGLPGLQRYVTVDFPVFAAAGSWRRNLGLAAMIMVFLYAQAFFVFLWVAGIGIF